MDAGLETNLNQLPFESAVTIVFAVSAVTAILAVFSNKGSVLLIYRFVRGLLEMILLHSISTE